MNGQGIMTDLDGNSEKGNFVENLKHGYYEVKNAKGHIIELRHYKEGKLIKKDKKRKWYYSKEEQVEVIIKIKYLLIDIYNKTLIFKLQSTSIVNFCF